MLCLKFSERSPQRCRFVRADTFDEVHEGGLATPRIGRLIERVDHQTRDELVATVGRRVAVGAVISVLYDEVLLRKPLQHRHDRRVGEVALRRQRFMHLPDGLGSARRP